MKTVVSFNSPLGRPIRIVKQTFPSINHSPTKRVSFVAGIHGDELEGIFLCHKLIQYLRALQETQPQAFRGEVNVYPAVNPLSVNNGARLWPFFSVDMNRTIGHGKGESLPQQTSRAFFEDLKSSTDLAVDIHASNTQLKELSQIRIIEGFEKKLIPLASHCNMDLIWVHPMAGLFESTLGYNLNKEKIPTLVVETGTCLRIDQEISEQIFTGMVNLLEQTGVISRRSISQEEIKTPRIVRSQQAVQVHSKTSGLFVSRCRLGQRVKENEPIGQMVDPVRGMVIEEAVSPGEGMLFTLRENPLAWSGAVLARVALDALPEK